MKWSFIALLSFLFFNGNAQNNQSKISKLFPTVSSFKLTELDKIVSKAKGEKFELSFADNLITDGIIKNAVIKSPNLQTLIIELPQLGKSLFQLSKRINSDRSISYIGFIINTVDGYIYQLRKVPNGSYQLSKQDLYKLLPTCNILK